MRGLRVTQVFRPAFKSLLVLLASAPLAAQTFSQRGFVELKTTGYPQAAVNDDTRAVGDVLARYEPAFQAGRWLRVRGAVEARLDTDGQVARSWRVAFSDRSRKRPALSIRDLSATLSRGRFTADAGKQFIRWGKADIVNPTDRFAPRDFLGVIDNDFLAVTGVRLAWGTDTDIVEAVWVPRFTPSRIPLYNRRWTVLPEDAAGVQVLDLGATFPKGRQIGARWNHVASGYEYSLSVYDGYNHLPLIDARVYPTLVPPPILAIGQRFPHMRMVGADLAWPLPWLTLKAETAYFTSPGRQADEYVQYVVQAERQVGELFLVGGYAGEAVTVSRTAADFAPDRGLTRAFLGRASYTLDTNRSVGAEVAVRRNLDSAWLKGNYSQVFGDHWRVTLAASVIRGDPTDFIGQYRRNSHVSLTARCSF
jgi:hypothetical protein